MNKQQKTNFIRTAVIMLLAAATLGLLAFFYVNAVNKSMREETRDSLSEVARQNASVIQMQIDGDFQTMRAVALFLGEVDELNPAEVVEALGRQQENTQFKRMGLIMPDGTAVTTDHLNMNLAEREYFKRGMEGQSTASDVLTDVTDGKQIYVYATPVFQDGKVMAVLFAANDIAIYSSIIDTNLFAGAGYSYIINKQGDILLSQQHPRAFAVGNNVFKLFEDGTTVQTAEVDQMQTNILHDERGVISYTRDGQAGYLCYTPIEINDWYVLSSVSVQVAAKKSAHLTGLTFTACIVAVTVFMGLCLYVMMMQNKNRKALKRLAYCDPVTGGNNWNGFMQEARTVLDNAQDTRYVMAIFDIDKFKVLNDLLGHHAGNRTMKCIYGALRETLDAEEPFSRSSADNFNLLMKYTTEAEILARVDEIIRRMTECCAGIVAGYTVTFSFGLYRPDALSEDISMMSDRANIARRTVKGKQGSNVAFYDGGVREKIIAEKNIENQMVNALANGEFEVFLQPKYSISTRKMVGSEALVRWRHSIRGMISPAEFIPVFEKNGFVVNIDLFVLEVVCHKQRAWLDAGLQPTTISVNLSRAHLRNPDFVKNILAVVERHQVPPRLIELEITETSALDFEDMNELIGMMNRLRASGFEIAMDDFGTGYSSLNLLRELPVNVLKLDREFFGRSTDNARGETVISDVVTMARHLDLTVVAEGVETLEQVEFLSSIGCDIVQGYYFAKPMPLADFETLWAKERGQLT